MAQACEVCGKAPQRGNSITTRGKAKYLGGVGTKITGITRREFKPNLQNIRVTIGGRNKSMRVCTQCIRSGSVMKLVRAAPFKLPTDAAKSGGKTEKKASKVSATAKATAKPKGTAKAEETAKPKATAKPKPPAKS